MNWWAWILFWGVFWSCAFAHLVWRIWKVWPHLCDFWQTITTAWQRVEHTHHTARELSDTQESARRSQDVAVIENIDSIAWNTPATHWRAEWRAMRHRQRELRLDNHATTWARWKRRVD